MNTITKKSVLAPDIVQLEVEAPLIAEKRKPGNFVIVRPTPTGERIPLTIVECDRQEGTISLIIQAIGKTTRMIHEMQEGDRLTDVVGPLGEPTPVEQIGTVACIGGGVGTAVVYPMAKALKEAGNRVIGIIGARDKDSIILKEEMESVSDELYITTDDGSFGIHGMVTDALRKVPDELNRVYTAGPLPMMKAVAWRTEALGIKTLASLNPIMMDGTGMCGACRVAVDGKLKFACVDGPEFNAHHINFDELIARNKTYVDQEKQALEAYNQQQCRMEEAHEQQ